VADARAAADDAARDVAAEPMGEQMATP
jgi:hypothetical protein